MSETLEQFDFLIPYSFLCTQHNQEAALDERLESYFSRKAESPRRKTPGLVIEKP